MKLGTVTGMNLAENCRAHLPRWLNISLYILAESAIIATDIAEVGPPEVGVMCLTFGAGAPTTHQALTQTSIKLAMSAN